MIATKAYAALDAKSPLKPFKFKRREIRPNDVEVIPVKKINEAYERMIKNDVRYRFVIDMSTL